MVTQYSLGFLHNDDEVVLIKKNRPNWQAGKLNGVGGHVELGESFHDAQVREFEEETGIVVPEWDLFCTLSGTNSTIACYAAYNNDEIYHVETKTDEHVARYEMWNIVDLNTVPNLQWLLPLAMNRGNYYPITVEFRGD